MIVFLFLNLGQAHADNDVYVQNIKVQPSAVKLGDTFTVTATLVNNSTGPIWVVGGKCSIKDIQAELLTVTFDNHAKIKTKNGLFCAGVGWYQKLEPGQNLTTTTPDYTSTFVATESGTADGKIRFSYHVFNLTDPTQPGYDGSVSQPFQFAISDQSGSKSENVYGGGGPVVRITLGPLQQFKTGIAPKDVKCNEGFQLVIKAEDGSPACASPDTAQKLIERGWAKEIVTTNQTSSSQNSNSSRIRTNPIAGLENYTGIINWKNQTYYFETPNYTKTTNGHPAQILFHNVLFTLFPDSFGGSVLGNCEGMLYVTDAKFSDGTSEMLHVFVDSTCGYDDVPIKLSTHTNPQAGLTIYDGKMKLLVSTGVTNPRLDFTTNSSSIQSGHAIGISISLENTSPEPLTLAVQNHWQRNDLSLGSCSNLPIGIAILKGYYTEQNMSEADSLWLYPNLPCPMPLGITGYTFQPMSNVATRECSPSFSCHDSIAIKGNLTIGGYLSGNGNVIPFESGTYTIVGGDEWGDVALRHFTVTNNSNPLGITALVIYHPFLGCLGPCPPNNFYLKINSNSSAYLFGYDICNGQSCVRNDTLSVPLPLNSPLKPEYAQVWLPQDVNWHDGDTVHMQLNVSSLPDNRTTTILDLGNSTIVP